LIKGWFKKLTLSFFAFFIAAKEPPKEYEKQNKFKHEAP
jgi:hypothetical protein